VDEFPEYRDSVGLVEVAGAGAADLGTATQRNPPGNPGLPQRGFSDSN